MTATRSARVTDYAAAAAALPDQYFLGQVVSFTISEADIRLDDIHGLVEEFGLRQGLLKTRLRPIDAFKKATTDVARKFAKTSDAQHSFLVRSVGQDATESHRHVVFERAVFRTGERRRLNHDTVLKLIYDRGERRDGTRVNDSIYVEEVLVPGLRLSGEEQAWLDGVVGDGGKNLRERYEHYCTHMDSHAVRTFVRNYLTMLGAINLKGNGGGLYFVQQKHVDELRGLQSVVKAIGSQLHLLPLLDIVGQRDMLAEAFIADTMEEVRQLSAEMGRILQDQARMIEESTYDNYAARAAQLIEKAKEYQALLDRNLDTASFEISVFQKKTLKLVSRIQKPASLSVGKK